ncbi:spore photoproduct lyase [Paenibacillus polymyxa]|uniref:spore photoproduct lyase n=1 Tax=Paenibacillus polymyxa TaxID=1406 RepID=UPI00083D85CE|nr:spore photoproduct lyase [Paenibacillus polymyxa]ODB62390.1 spore photoproduct lyase [Paenibacillus polymyxa]
MSTLERTPVQTRGTKPFLPDLVFFEPDALNYPKGQRIMDWVKAKDIPYRMTTSHNRITNLPGETEVEKYRMAKKTLVVGIRKTLTFDQSKPSAEYAIPISTGCMGHCHYCYLQTTLGAKPYIRVYVNTDDILSAAKAYIEERAPEITRFEAACTSDPVGLEHITGTLGDLIRFMADEEFGRLRFVTKYHHVDPLLDIKHNGHTRIRFSINSDYVIKQFEPATSRFEERIEAAGKIARAGYPLGFIIAPIIWYAVFCLKKKKLLRKLGETLPQHATKDLTFELIQHRFTKTSKAVIEKRYPKTKLEMDIEKRKKKWGRWGQNKYVYPDEQQNALREFITERIFEHFPLSRIEYFT